MWIFKSLVTYYFPTNRLYQQFSICYKLLSFYFKILIFLKRRSCQGEARCPRVRVHCHPIWPSFLSLPLQNLCDVPLTFLSLQDQVSKARSHWTFMALCSWKSEKKLIIKKNYEDDFAHYCYYCCYCPPILFSKKIKKKCLFILPTERVLLLFLLTTVYIFNTYFLTEGFLLCKEAAVTLSKIKYMFLKN